MDRTSRSCPCREIRGVLDNYCSSRSYQQLTLRARMAGSEIVPCFCAIITATCASLHRAVLLGHPCCSQQVVAGLFGCLLADKRRVPGLLELHVGVCV